MATDLAKIAKSKKIEYFLISFVDLFGVGYDTGTPGHVRCA